MTQRCATIQVAHVLDPEPITRWVRSAQIRPKIEICVICGYFSFCGSQLQKQSIVCQRTAFWERLASLDVTNIVTKVREKRAFWL